MDSSRNRHAQPPAPALRSKKTRPMLRTHKRAFFLIAFYIAIILVTWIVTAKLSFRPLTKGSWDYAPGISYEDYRTAQAWARAIPILNAVAAILAIPILSSIIAQAVVVFAQKRYPGQHLSVRQLFALADHSWGSPRTLLKMLWWDEPGHARVNWFLIACTGLVVVGAAQFPLYQILMSWEKVTMATCADTRYIDYGLGQRTCDFNLRVRSKFEGLGYTLIGNDLEPAQMAVIPAQYILPRMKRDLAALREYQAQPFTWRDRSATTSYGEFPRFVAAIPEGTTTGVLREHVTRLNSTVSCTSLDMSGFPAMCAGENPFQASLEYRGDYDWGKSDSNSSAIDICAPGDLGKHPWTVSRNRQELSEEVFLRFSGDEYTAGVVHCTGLTTRGYFELGNMHNGNTFGPLLDAWPSSGTSLEEHRFHDYMGYDWGSDSQHSTDGYIPSEADNERGGARPIPDARTWRDDLYTPHTYTNMSGPLMTSVLSLFGPGSWLSDLANLTSSRTEGRDDLSTLYSSRPALLSSLCDALPFRHFKGYPTGDTYGHDGCANAMLYLMMTYSDHISLWSRNDTAEARFNVAMALANQAALTSHTQDVLPWQRDTGREIYTAPGIGVWKPNVSLASLVVLSIIVGIQVLGLLFLACWIAMWPTWTRTLDAMALARLASSLDPSVLPPMRTLGEKDWAKLAHVDGLVGVQLMEGATEQRRDITVVASNRGADNGEIEMRALSVASTVGKEPTNEAIPVSAADTLVLELGLGASGLVSKRWGRQAQSQSQT